MFTLDGRMRFALALKPVDEANFNEKKLREIVLSCRADGVYELSFLFDDELDKKASELMSSGNSEVPEYVMVEEAS